MLAQNAEEVGEGRKRKFFHLRFLFCFCFWKINLKERFFKERTYRLLFENVTFPTIETFQ